MPGDADCAQHECQQCRQHAARGTVEQPYSREKPMCTGHNHGSAGECGCDNDECVEVPRHDDPADCGADQRQNGAEDATDEVIQSEDRRHRKPNEGARRKAEQNAPIRLKNIRRAEQDDRADNAKDNRHQPDVAGQPPAQEQAYLESKQAVEERQPRVKQEYAASP